MRAAVENESGDGDGKRIISNLAKAQNNRGRQWEAALEHLQHPGGLGWVALCPPTRVWLAERGFLWVEVAEVRTGRWQEWDVELPGRA